MSLGHWAHILHAAQHDKSESKWSAVFMIILGLFLAPVLIGIPLILIGVYKLCK